jgi:heat shock protein HslJ
LQGAVWTLQKINVTPALASLAVTAEFGADGSLTGNTGCNDYSARYTLSGEGAQGQITITDVAMLAQAACRSEQATQQEMVYLQFLPLMATYQSNGLWLQMCSADRSFCLEFVSDLRAILQETQWAATQYTSGTGAVTPIIATNPPVSALFSGGIVKGYAGCAFYEGQFSVTGATITITALHLSAASESTADCPPEVYNQEVLYLEALSKAKSYLGTMETLTLLDENGNLLIDFGVLSAPSP